MSGSKIISGLEEAVAVARGEVELARVRNYRAESARIIWGTDFRKAADTTPSDYTAPTDDCA